METAKRPVVVRGYGEKGRNWWSTEDLGGKETTLCDAVMVSTCDIHLSKPIRMYTPKSEPRHKLWTLGDDEVSV